MSRSKATSALALAAILLLAGAGCGDRIGHATEARLTSASTIELRLSGPSVGVPERPPVEFRHDLHEAALAEEGCKTCHVIDEKKNLVLWLKGTEAGRDQKDPRVVTNPEAATEAFHKVCIGCHTKRAAAAKKSGPAACGQCHVERPEAVSERKPVRYDSSLHARHVKALRDVQKEKDRCDLCHHELDKAQKKLVYVENQEGPCSDCHGAKTVDKTRSLRDGAHVMCVSCHLDRRARKEEAGPIQCAGCHGLAHQKAWKKISPIPRLKRKDQPDTAWIRDENAKSRLVPFPHEKHESAKATTFCTDCHHRTLKKCRECHTLTGKPEGKGITLEQAYHLATSTYSCVGCHSDRATAKPCAGCHRMVLDVPGEISCPICHSGPRPAEAETVSAASVLGETPVPPPLPKFSDDDYPEKLELKLLAHDFKPTKFPHGKIVAKLVEGLKDRHLAARFHTLPKTGLDAGSLMEGAGGATAVVTGSEGGNAILCAGCHHKTPLGRRPPPCASCHSSTPDPTSDKPRLLAAYHRQCMGCHKALHLPNTCTHCHEKAGDKVKL